MKKLLKYIFVLLLFFYCEEGLTILKAQNVNIEEVINFRKKKPIKLGGGVSASTGYFTSQPEDSRQPFTYQLNGTVNISIYELLNIPLSFSLNNYGSKFSYPSLPNRFSLHPSYKWIRAHIGDVSMSFGPYTFNGHQFTGAGLELSPGKWQIYVMSGRLQKSVSYNDERRDILPTYNRFGYGIKSRYNGGKYYIGCTFFTAKDKLKKTSFKEDSLGIYPKRNVALGVESGISLIKNLTFSLDYGLSVLTRDIRAPKSITGSVFSRLLGELTTTSVYHAFKADLSYMIKGHNIGIGYEYISPEYETLGAYYFNNDYENITLNYSTSVFTNKLSLSLSGGLQHDDLSGKKTERNLRLVGSANINFTPNERINVSLLASSFQGYRNIKSSFDYINSQTPYDNLDTLKFTQISNSLDFNFNWIVSKSDKIEHNFMTSLNYQEAGDKQGEYILPGNLTRFFNGTSGYRIEFVPQGMSTSIGISLSNNYSGRTNMFTFGPVFNIVKGFFNKTLTTGLNISWNRTINSGEVQSTIANLRCNLSYRFCKRHSLTSNICYQYKKQPKGTIPFGYSFNMQLNYNYSF